MGNICFLEEGQCRHSICKTETKCLFRKKKTSCRRMQMVDTGSQFKVTAEFKVRAEFKKRRRKENCYKLKIK